MSDPSVSSEPSSNSGQGVGLDGLFGAATSMATEQVSFGKKRGAKVPDAINPKDIKKMMSLTNSTMKGFKSVMWLHKVRTYLMVGAVVSLLVIIGTSSSNTCSIVVCESRSSLTWSVWTP